MNRKTGVILSYVLIAFEILSTLLLTPYIIHTLGQAEFGVFKLSAAITVYLLLLDLGVGNAVVRYVSKYRAKKDKIKEQQFLGVVIIFYIIVGIFSFFLGCLLVKIFPKLFAKGLNYFEIILGQKLLFITVLNCAITLATSYCDSVILAYENYKVSKGCSIFQLILRILITYIALKLGYRSVGIVLVNLFTTIIGKLIMMWYIFVKIKLRPILRGVDINFIKEVVVYSSLIFVQMIATQINSTVDQILLGSFVSSSAIILGIYGIGAQIVQYYQTIGVAFSGVLMPGVVKMVEKSISPQVIMDEMVRIGRIMFMLLAIIWACFLVNGKNFIILWAGNENELAYYISTFLMFAYMFILSEAIGSQILWALNLHKEQSYLKIAIVLLNIFLTVFLIKWNPLIGATIGTFISLVLGDIVVMNIIFKKKLKISIVSYYKNLFKGILPCILITICFGFLSSNYIANNWLGFIVKVLIMVIVYIICMLIFGINNYEKKLFYSILKVKYKEEN